MRCLSQPLLVSHPALRVKVGLILALVTNIVLRLTLDILLFFFVEKNDGLRVHKLERQSSYSPAQKESER